MGFQSGNAGARYTEFSRDLSQFGESDCNAIGATDFRQIAHKLYLGTSLYTDRGIVSVAIDGVAGTPLDCFYNQATAPVVTRRLLSASTISAGMHTVTFSLQSGNHAALGAWDANSGGQFSISISLRQPCWPRNTRNSFARFRVSTQ
jgi:hypothetical protein